MEILISILSLGSLGFLFGLGLAFASKKFRVISNLQLEEIYAKLPQANCGACGMAGCWGFAEGLTKGLCAIERCVVAEEGTREEIAKILGVELKPKLKTVAVLHCQGGKIRAKDKFIYKGIKDCISANLLMLGPKACIYGCIGYRSCVRACAFGAIMMSEEDLPVIDEDKCTSCRRCVEVCPKQLFSLVPKEKIYIVKCNSKDLGRKVREVCTVGCIGCGRCEKVCSVDAIHVIDNLAVIDFEKCNSCGECFKVCPRKCIQARF